MSLLDVSTSALLSGKVLALDVSSDKYKAQQDLAEAVLGLTSLFLGKLTIDQTNQVIMAVALQLNFQVEQGLDPFVLKSDSSQQQGETKVYQNTVVHPQARAILDGIDLSTPTGGQVEQEFHAIRPVRSVRGSRHGRAGIRRLW